MKSNPVHETYAKILEEKEIKKKQTQKKNSKWINITLMIAFLGVLTFGSYQLYYAMQPIPWYTKLFSKACSILYFW